MLDSDYWVQLGFVLELRRSCEQAKRTGGNSCLPQSRFIQTVLISLTILSHFKHNHESSHGVKVLTSQLGQIKFRGII